MPLLSGYAADAVIADKGYDSDTFVLKIENSGAEAVIPPRRNRLEQRDYELHSNFVYGASGGDPVGVNSIDVLDAG